MRRVATSGMRLASAVFLMLMTLPAPAAVGSLSVRSAIHDGPGIRFKVLGYVEPGRLMYGPCKLNLEGENWCYVDRPVDPGWVHVEVRLRQKASADGGATPSSADEGPGEKPGQVAEGGDPADGNEGISPIDGASLPADSSSGGGTTKGDRLAAAGLTKSEGKHGPEGK